MYQLIDTTYNNVLATDPNPNWLRQQKLVDRPINANNLDEADGVVITVDGTETFYGISDKQPDGSFAPRNMANYPQVYVVEVPSDPIVFQRMKTMQAQLDAVHAYQTETTVLTADLDNSYREGVNSL